MFNNPVLARAGGTIAPSVFVKIDTTADGQVVQAGAGDLAIGVSQPGMKRAPGLPGSDTTIAAQVNDPIQFYALGDVCSLTLGGTVTRGDFLKSDANGKGITTTTLGDWVAAQALQSGTTGVMVLVRIVAFHYHAGS